MASIEERMSLDNAVKKALAKEREERGLTDEPISYTTYVAHLMINGNLTEIKNKDLDTFLAFARKYQKAFPRIPMYLYTYTELQSDQSTKVV